MVILFINYMMKNTMKKILSFRKMYLVGALLMGISWTSCSDDNGVALPIELTNVTTIADMNTTIEEAGKVSPCVRCRCAAPSCRLRWKSRNSSSRPASTHARAARPYSEVRHLCSRALRAPYPSPNTPIWLSGQ